MYLLAMPMTEFCSCTTTGTPVCSAARATGMDTYPPNATTASGLISRNHSLALRVLFIMRATPLGSVVGCLRLNPDDSKPAKGMPASGTMRDSMPFGVPANHTSHPSALSLSARASAG